MNPDIPKITIPPITAKKMKRGGILMSSPAGLHDRSPVAPLTDHEADIRDSRIHALIDDMGDDRLVAEREEFLGYDFGPREEPCP